MNGLDCVFIALGNLEEGGEACMARLWEQMAPFYVAPDYERAPAAKD